MDNGAAFGKIIDITTNIQEYRVPLKDLKAVKMVTMARPYPSFLPYYFSHSYDDNFHLANTESIQFSIGPGMTDEELKEEHGIGIRYVRLE